MLPLPDTYAYDASGIRYKKTESINGVEVETFTVYTGNDILLEETYSEGAWKTARIEFTVAGASAGRFEKDYSTSQEAVRYYYQDHLGSRIGVTDEAGVVLATIAYDVWGNAAASGSSGYDAESEIRFTGKPMDATGLYYFNARYYDPQSKRFLTEDPIQQGMNWYTYCGNDPVNFRDPRGLTSVKDEPNERLSDEDKKARDNFDSKGRKGNYESYRETPDREDRPLEALTQRVLPYNPITGKNSACFFRAVIRIAEDLAGFFLTAEELNDIWSAALEAGLIDEQSTIQPGCAGTLFKMGLESVGIGGGTPYLDSNPKNAVGSLIKLTRLEKKVETGVSSLHEYTRSKHAQTGDAFGNYTSDPWGSDISDTYYNGTEVFYAHY